jgi:hypothetical protein
VSGAPARNEAGRALDDDVEVQVHGAVRLAGDARGLVGEPSLRGADVGAGVETIAARFGLELGDGTR